MGETSILETDEIPKERGYYMRFLKTMVAITAAAMLVLTGCSTEPSASSTPSDVTSLESSNSIVESGESSITTSGIAYAPLSDDQKEALSNNVAVDEKNIWEKEFSSVEMKDIVIGEDWPERIMIRDAEVSSKQAADISILENFFFENENISEDLQTVYRVPTLGHFTSSPRVYLTRFTSMRLDVTTTTLNEYAVIEEILCTVATNPHEEGGLKTLSETAPYATDKNFGLGSTYEQVMSVIGEPNDVFTDSVGDGLNSTTCVYVSETAEMILTFMWFEEDGQDTAALMTINWLPMQIREMLHTQEGIQDFVRYAELVEGVEPTTSTGEPETEVGANTEVNEADAEDASSNVESGDEKDSSVN